MIVKDPNNALRSLSSVTCWTVRVRSHQPGAVRVRIPDIHPQHRDALANVSDSFALTQGFIEASFNTEFPVSSQNADALALAGSKAPDINSQSKLGLVEQ